MGRLETILAALGDESWRVRKDAALAAAAWPRTDESIPALVALLHPDAEVAPRSAALEALANLGATATPALVAVIEARQPGRKFAIDALAAMRPPAARAAAAALCGCLGDDEADENVRGAAAEALGGLGLRPGSPAAASAIAVLARQIHRGSLLARLCALEALAALDARLPLADVVALADDDVLRPAALDLAGRTGDLEALPHLLHALTATSGERAAALQALVFLHDRQTAPEARVRVEASVRACPSEAVGAIVAAVEEGPLVLRRAAAALCGWGRTAEALPALCAALVDDELHDAAAAAIAAYGPFAVAPMLELARAAGPALRRELLAVFPRLGAAASDARVAELCGRALRDDDAATAAAAARALGEIGGKDALGPLAQALGRPGEAGAAAAGALARLAHRWPEEVRLLAGAGELDGPAGANLCRVLGALADPADRARLLGGLRAGEPVLRRAAAAALAAFRHPETVEALIFALADDDAPVRACAAAALGTLAAREAAAALIGACRDPDAATAVAAARALGRANAAEASVTLRVLAGGGGAVAFAAVDTLGTLGQPADDDTLCVAVTRADPEVAKAAARALGDRPRPAAREALIGVLAHPRWDVRRAAAQALAHHPRSAEIVAALRARVAVEDDPLVGEALDTALDAAPRQP